MIIEIYIQRPEKASILVHETLELKAIPETLTEQAK
jgi:hypothetical protein